MPEQSADRICNSIRQNVLKLARRVLAVIHVFPQGVANQTLRKTMTADDLLCQDPSVTRQPDFLSRSDGDQVAPLQFVQLFPGGRGCVFMTEIVGQASCLLQDPQGFQNFR